MTDSEEKPPIVAITGPNFENSNAAIAYTNVEDGLSTRSSDELTREFSIVDEPPDGGAGWIQVLAAHLELFNTFGYINSYGLFEAYYVEHLGLSLSAISWAGSTQTFLLLSIGIFSGRLFDAGYLRPLLIAGTAAQLLGVFTTSLATQYWQLLLAQGICGGIGAGLAYCPMLACVSTYFSKKRTMAITIATAGTSTGGVVFPVIAQQLLPRVGFAWTVRCMGFVMLFNAVIIILIARPRLPPRKSGKLIELSAFRELPYTLFTVGTFLVLWTVYICYNYIPHYASAVLGIDTGTSLTMLLILNGVGVAGRVLPAIISDRYIGPLYTLAPLAFASGILYFAWIGVKSMSGLYVFAAVSGFVNGGCQGMGMAGLPSLTSDLRKMGTRSGMVLTIASVAALTGSPVTGALIQAGGGSYLYMQIWAGCGMIIAGCIMVAARLAKNREGAMTAT